MERLAIAVVDAQNGFCHARGAVSYHFDTDIKRELRRTIERIAALLSDADRRGIPYFFFAANSSLADHPVDAWHTAIEGQLEGFLLNAPIFWRDAPWDTMFGDDVRQYLRGMGISRLMLVGFYSDKCVTHAAIEASQWGLKPRIVRDCVWPAVESGFEERLRRSHIASFISSDEI